MPDNPKKKGQDRKRRSKQPHEAAYRRRKTRGTNRGTSRRATAFAS